MVLGPGALVTTNTAPGPGMPGIMLGPQLTTHPVSTNQTKSLPSTLHANSIINNSLIPTENFGALVTMREGKVRTVEM